MKKGKITITITIGIICFILVLVMTMQFKVVNQTDITSIENMRESELRTELSSWKEKYEEINSKYEETAQKVAEYKQETASETSTSELLDEELNQIDMALGKTDVEGDGIVITLKDNEEKAIAASDLLILVNTLKDAGAEAISINEQRITNMSDIVYISYTFIRVNGQRIVSPYVIKAIGNQNYLESSLLGNGGYIDELEKDGYSASIEKTKNIQINKYSGDITTKYIE